MADSKENYQWDLGSERVKIYSAPYWTICIQCNLQKFDTYYVLFYFWLLLNTERMMQSLKYADCLCIEV